MALGPPSSSPCTFEGGVEFVFLLSVGQIWSSSHYRWLILIPNPLSSSWQRFQTPFPWLTRRRLLVHGTGGKPRAAHREKSKAAPFKVSVGLCTPVHSCGSQVTAEMLCCALSAQYQQQELKNDMGSKKRCGDVLSGQTIRMLCHNQGCSLENSNWMVWAEVLKTTLSP